MMLGCPTAVAAVAPPNFTTIIRDNDIDQIAGKQQTATAGATAIMAVSKSAG